MVEFRYDSLAAHGLKAACFVIDVRFDSMGDLSYNKHRHIIDFHYD